MTISETVIDTLSIIGEPFDLCEVPAGEFLYGEIKRKITLPGFAIAKYTITYSQFQTFIDAPDGFFDDRWWEGFEVEAEHRHQPEIQRQRIADYPRENVSWFDTMAFCRWLSHHLGGGIDLDHIMVWKVRLPTEFEWEKAARGTDGRKYPWGDMFDTERCNTRQSGIRQTTPVTQYLQGASPYRVMDLCGNVHEWCLNDYDAPMEDITQETLHRDAIRVLRGGSWMEAHDLCQAAFHNGAPADDRQSDFGFRVVLMV